MLNFIPKMLFNKMMNFIPKMMNFIPKMLAFIVPASGARGRGCRAYLCSDRSIAGHICVEIDLLQGISV